MRAEKFVLSNGLKVVHLNTPSSPFYKMLLNVPVGAVHDPVGKAGLAHILEHAVFCGSEEKAEDDLLRDIRKAGGYANANTGWHQTQYEMTASSSSPENFYTIADSMRQFVCIPALEPERIAIEKEIILNELYDGLDNRNHSICENLFQGMHAEGSKYLDIIGSEETIRSVVSEDLRSFIKETYDAAEMTLYTAGPIDRKDLDIVLEQTLSAIPNQGKPLPSRYTFSCRDADLRSLSPDLKQNHTAMMFVFPYAQSVREKIIELEASNHMQPLLSETLRKKYGCLYGVRIGGWNTDDVTSVKYLAMSNTPQHSRIACDGIVKFYNEIDTIFSDDLLNAGLERSKFNFSNPDFINAETLNLAAGFHEKFGVLFDLDEAAHIIGTIKPEEIRGKVRQLFSSIKGINVVGPQPDAVPSLKFMQDSMPAPEAVKKPSLDFGKRAAAPPAP